MKCISTLKLKLNSEQGAIQCECEPREYEKDICNGPKVRLIVQNEKKRKNETTVATAKKASESKVG